ncbi:MULTISPECIES: hypothetical protein [Cryobacterium]|uniref:Type II toxin-antitoxin system VapB family antitoxin n=1 Tax=Cryobacterium levicorallinum TaxID=995038 RepID=A0A1I2ZJC0_9MICO|nr:MULTISPECIES: hypothetical protein [Cryobacterium]TFB89491.1 hypothetical protein E3O11_00305 [Cryobacterium levicorallinum]TFD56669.1 hypothetical protein E3T41_15950 [Cryobacterium sp. Hh38]SFH37579.1 hypothetical protein SAMN05216274_10467 [Cryobacterium levicorallinum]
MSRQSAYYGAHLKDRVIDTDPALLRELKEAYGLRSNKEAVAFAIGEAVMRRRQLVAIDAIAALHLDPQPKRFDLDE